MGFVKTLEQAIGAVPKKPQFFGAEMLAVMWETKPEIVRRLLPPPLKPAKRPLALAFAAHYPKTNFGVTYFEAALFLRASFEGVEGQYCLAMPVTDDMALALGREVFGYPKKIGRISLKRDGAFVEGWAERHGQRFVHLKTELTGSFNSDDAVETAAEIFGAGGNLLVTAYNFKHFPSPDLTGFDYNPRLIREEVEFRPETMEIGPAEIVLEPSSHDPWHEIEVVRPLGAVYTKGDNTMLPGTVVAELTMEEFAPYAFLKWDF